MATTAEDVWRILAELAEAQKETERQLKEQATNTDRQIQRVSKQLSDLGRA